MIGSVRHWFVTRSRRERLLIAVMLAIAVPLLVWALVYRPVDDALTAAKTRNVEAVQQHGRVVAQLAQLKDAGSATRAPFVGEPGIVLAESARRNGIVLADFSLQAPNTVSFTTQAGQVTAALRWLQELEAQGIRVVELQITPGAGGVALTGQLGWPGP